MSLERTWKHSGSFFPSSLRRVRIPQRPIKEMNACFLLVISRLRLNIVAKSLSPRGPKGPKKRRNSPVLIRFTNYELGLPVHVVPAPVPSFPLSQLSLAFFARKRNRIKRTESQASNKSNQGIEAFRASKLFCARYVERPRKLFARFPRSTTERTDGRTEE